MTLIIETTASILGGSLEFNKVYSILWVLELLFYFSIFHKVIKNRLIRKVLVPGGLFIIGFCIYCFNEQFKTIAFSEIVVNPAFWICMGSLIFYACTFPIWAGTYVLLNVPEKEWVILSIVLDVANIILYSTFTMAFFCERIFGRVKADNEGP